MLRILTLLALIRICPAQASVCSSAETVLQRYTEAVGGKAATEVQTRVMTAKESTGARVTERYVYRFKWKAPNKVVAESTPYLFNVLPVSYPNGAFIFDGESWSNNDRRKSRNEERDPAWQRELRHKYPYNESPDFLMYRVLADPLMLTRATELYASLEPDLAAPAGLCVLRAYGTDVWRNKREDILSFDSPTGLLKTWKIEAGKTWVQFDFDDYRQVGAIKFPFQIHYDFYKSTFRYTKVVSNVALPDSDFVSRPAKP
jgi:hypothetical protein